MQPWELVQSCTFKAVLLQLWAATCTIKLVELGDRRGMPSATLGLAEVTSGVDKEACKAALKLLGAVFFTAKQDRKWQIYLGPKRSLILQTQCSLVEVN